MNVTIESYYQYYNDNEEMRKEEAPFVKKKAIFEEAKRKYNELFIHEVKDLEDTELMEKLDHNIKHLTEEINKIRDVFTARYPREVRANFSRQENVLKFFHALCGGEEKYNALPVLDIKRAEEQLSDHHSFIKYLPPMSATVMRGTDRLKRAFIAIRTVPIDKEICYDHTFTVYQGYQNAIEGIHDYHRRGPVVCRHVLRSVEIEYTNVVDLLKKIHELLTTRQVSFRYQDWNDSRLVTLKL